MSNIPTFIKQKSVDKEGNFTPPMQVFFDQLIQQMQDNLSDAGLVAPANTTANINSYANDTGGNSKPDGTIWYDTDTNEFKGKTNGIVKVFTLT